MIKVLDKQVADKIAAGEVVDRPLSVVKELVENAIDAGASSVVIEIKNGGKTYIRVTDNGCGIRQSEASTAFQRHATSKITTDKDLESIETLGFRGEALASIAAVSRTELITKTADEKMGTKLHIDGGHIAENLPTGCPDGTTVIITDLFYNTPARLKFMKSDGTESGLIIDFVSQIALAYADINIRLINNGNILFSTQGKGDRYNSILTVYSKEIGKQLIPFHAEKEYLMLEGYVSNPAMSKTTKRSQIFFVNGRVISSKIMDQGVTNAYFDKLFEGRHPVAFLFLRSAPEKLDVNIHPNKKEVRFDDEKFVSNFITETIRCALMSKEAMPEVKSQNIFKVNQQKPLIQSDDAVQHESIKVIKLQEPQVGIKSLLSIYRSEMENIPNQLKIENPLNQLEMEHAHTSPEEKKSVVGGLPISDSTVQTSYKSDLKTPKPFDFTNLKFIGSIFATYITAVDEDCFYLIDQHAAHERIFFEQLLRQYQDAEKLQQTIMIPFVVNTTYAISESSYDWLDTLTAFGFEIEEFGPKSYIVKAVPAFMELSEAQDFIEYFLDNITEDTDLENMAKIEKITSNACKSAVKAHDLLSEEEIKQLISDLSRCENPYSCPHGRPTFIKMSIHEIERLFKRV